jgi:hypothetical protein
MDQNTSKLMFRDIMIEFADLTGLLPDGVPPRRYLWTDAFAVCNFLELYQQTGEQRYKQLALDLVDQVHNILGRHRDDDPRIGWISGLDEQGGKIHPTIGGLRIGKTMNERRPDDPYDEQSEWDRDGQYFHYLTKWMHALNCVSRVTGDSIYNRWAIELAKTAHAKFIYVSSSGKKRMCWKMSIDLTCPLVSSMGQHDPIEGFVAYLELQETAAQDSQKSAALDLSAELTDMTNMCERKSWATADPLGIGELLSLAYKLARLIMNEGCEHAGLLSELLDSSLIGVRSFGRSNPSKLPADYRLAFRELGLSIGLHAIEKLLRLINQTSGDFEMKHLLRTQTESLMNYVPLSEMIEAYWLEPVNRKAGSWTAHRDINMVMLATSLVPDGYLTL